MKTKKIISLFAAVILICGIIGGCGSEKTTTKSDIDIAIESIKPEDGHTLAIAENIIIPDFVTSTYSDSSNLHNEYNTATHLFKDHVLNQEFMDKYGYKDVINMETYSNKDIQKANPEFYANFSTFHMINSLGSVLKAISLGLNNLPQVQSYLEDTLMNKGNTGYRLAEDYSKLNPKNVVQSYLKNNKIEITSVTCPNKYYYLGVLSTFVLTIDIPIEGTKDGVPFKDTLRYDFHFVVDKEAREGAEFNSKNELEIMAVTNSCYDEELKSYDYSRLKIGNVYK